MKIHRALVVLLIALATSGCDKITGMVTGAVDPKTSDAQAIGYACRVSLKKPEDCMKENDTQSTTAVLTGWKAADKDISERTLDPSMGSNPATAVILKSASAPESTEEKAGKDEKSSDKEKASDKTSDKEKTSDNEPAEPKATGKKSGKSH